MNISGTGATPIQPQTAANPVDKRAQLQAMLLRKSLEMQQAETAAVMREAEGKGQSLDIRV
jgi:hypothetical protein